MVEQNKLHDIKERLANLSSDEREVLLAQIRRKLETNHTVSEKKDHPHALTSAQQRLWVLEKFDRVKYLYHVPLILELPISIDNTKLQSALRVLCQEQAQLSSYFVEDNQGEIRQHYATDLIFSLAEINLNDILLDVLNIQKEQPIADFFLQPFELNKPPLIRFAVARAKGCQYLLICCHHLIMDAWSAGLLMRRLSEIYSQPTLIESNKPYDASYSAYAAWEENERRLSGYVCELAYWENQRERRSWEIDLVTDFPRSKYLSGEGQSKIHQLSDGLFAKVSEFARLQCVSVNHVVLAVFQIILARYSGQDDIAVGIPVAGRQQKSWQKTIGLFVNTCLHAVKLNYSHSFTHHLAQTKAQLLQDIMHANVPYDYLLKHFYQHQLCAHGANFNVLYNFLQHDQANDIYFAEGVGRTRLCLLPISKFDLSLHVLMSTDQLTLIFEYSTDLFQIDTIEQIIKDFLIYLETFMNHAEESMTKLLWPLNTN